MRHDRFLTLVAGLATTAFGAAQLITSFEDPSDFNVPLKLNTRGVVVSPTTEYVTDGNQAMRLSFAPSTGNAWARVVMSTPLNCNFLGGYSIDVTNLEPTAVGIGFLALDGGGRQKNVYGTMAPFESARFVIIANPAMAVGSYYEMLYLPNPFPGTRAMRFLTFPLTLGDVRQVGVFIRPHDTLQRMVVDNVRVLPFVSMPSFLTGLVDEFGQYTFKPDWPGKVHSKEEILAQHMDESAWMGANGDSPEFNAYGGWAQGPKLTATGFFRTALHKGKQWLVDPSGSLFFSVGPTSARLDATITRTYKREHLFQWLPEKTSIFAEHYRDDPDYRKTMNFYTANVERKFGIAWREPWFQMTQNRLRRWGFNTLAYGLDSRYYGSSRLPYTMSVTTTGGPGAYIYPGTVYYGMPDPFDTRYKGWVASQISAFVDKVKADPEVIGWFIDNELPWSNRSDREDTTQLARDICAKDSKLQPAKAILVASLQQTYLNIAKLNAAWGTSFADWSKVQKPFFIAGPPTDPEMERDLKNFVYLFALRYFATIRTELKRLDPNHLYLGCRFDNWTPEVLRAASANCDVLSFNAYTADLKSPSFRYPQGHDFWDTLGKPVMVGEFHFTATDRGLYGLGLFPGQLEETMSPAFLPTQASRAASYIQYLTTAFQHPSVVGVHWHRYADDPVSGRAGGGLNANIGFVSITDTPYWDFILPVRDFNFSMYATRSKAK